MNVAIHVHSIYVYIYICTCACVWWCWCSRCRPLLTNAIAKLRHHTCKLYRATMGAIKINIQRAWHCLIFGLHHTVAKWSFYYRSMFMVYTCIHHEKAPKQCKLQLQRVIPATCNWSIREKAPRIQLQPLLTTTTFISSGSDMHWCWSCCFWPLHLNLLYTDSLAHTMRENVIRYS